MDFLFWINKVILDLRFSIEFNFILQPLTQSPFKACLLLFQVSIRGVCSRDVNVCLKELKQEVERL